MQSHAAGAGRVALLFSSGAISAAAFALLVDVRSVLALLALAVALLGFRSTRIWAALPAGMLWFSLHALWHQHDAWPDERAGETVELTGTIIGLPEQRDGRVRLEFKPDAEGRRAGAPGRILLSWYRPLEWFRPGETWRLSVTLTPPHGRVNPGLFDYHRYLVARGIGALGRIQSAALESGSGPLAAPDRFRQRLANWLQAETVSLDAAALHRALTVGDRTAMSPELAERLRRTGTAHLLSISGLHVGMVAGLAGLLAGLLATPLIRFRGVPDRKRVMLLAGLVAAFGYALLAGFSLPTVRALVMLLAGFGAMLWRRGIQPGRALLTALAAVLLIDPMAPLAIGFWLSFAAVAVLIWAFSGRSRGTGWLRGLITAQVVIAIGLLPLNIGIFQQWAPTALVANLVAIPLVGLWILPCLLAALALFALGLPAGFMVALSEHGLELFLGMLDGLTGADRWLAGLSAPALPAPGLAAIVIAAVGALWLLAPRGWPMRPLGAVLLLPLLWPAGRGPGSDPGEFELMIPDLGDGQAVIVRTASSVLLYGTGPGDGAERSLVPGTIAPLVRQGGRDAVDSVIVPYGHRDFAGGLAEVKRRWPGADVITPDGSGDSRCVEESRWMVDGVGFRFLHPSAALPDLGGDSSCVLEIRSSFGSVLLTGGIGANVTRRLAMRQSLRPVDVLIMPRFGRVDGLDAGWLSALSPTIGIATVSAFNRRGMPHPESRAMLRDAGGRLLSTGDCGALSIRFEAGANPLVLSEVSARPRFWRNSANCAASVADRR
ncbi:MAG TPA: DNA internalization-related competence protein ComEC/Rec2 [Wenzhouxiangellaceae bacterium]|nr:DNA internalization-related competence protein ComEC/Rec2 [Wenzhouxiangellaceae bacterium]